MVVIVIVAVIVVVTAAAVLRGYQNIFGHCETYTYRT